MGLTTHLRARDGTSGRRSGGNGGGGGNVGARIAIAVALFLSGTTTSVISATTTSTTSTTPPTTPVANWEASLAASEAQGTTVVVTFQRPMKVKHLQTYEVNTTAASFTDTDEKRDEESCDEQNMNMNEVDEDLLDVATTGNSCTSGCVVLFRSNQNLEMSSSARNKKEKRLKPLLLDGVPIFRDEDDEDDDAIYENKDNDEDTAKDITLSLLNSLSASAFSVSGIRMGRFSRRWCWFEHGHVLVCMTGSRFDVDHLYTLVQAYMDRHQCLYEGSHPVAIAGESSLIKMLAEALYYPHAQSTSSRPLGVQCLVLGERKWSDDMNHHFHDHGDDVHLLLPWMIMSLDPSGGYRHWGVATAIGRASRQIRQNLYQRLSSPSSSLLLSSPSSSSSSSHSTSRKEKEDANYGSTSARARSGSTATAATTTTTTNTHTAANTTNSANTNLALRAELSSGRFATDGPPQNAKQALQVALESTLTAFAAATSQPSPYGHPASNNNNHDNDRNTTQPHDPATLQNINHNDDLADYSALLILSQRRFLQPRQPKQQQRRRQGQRQEQGRPDSVLPTQVVLRMIDPEHLKALRNEFLSQRDHL